MATKGRSNANDHHHHRHDLTTPSKKRKTLIAPNTLQSDMDMAFQLQMQEAMAASLALSIKPSTPRLAPPPPPPHSKAVAPATPTTTKWAKMMRLYSKGLVSHEKSVAGLGIAICDCKDNVIFERKKCVMAFSGEAAELEALILGLKEALTLNLKRVTFYLDNKLLFNYVEKGFNRQVPVSSNITNLVHQVNTLRRKFEYCLPLLVESHDIKFAYKFATDAINSEVTSPAKTSKLEEKKVVDKLLPGSNKVEELVPQLTLIRRKLEYDSSRLASGGNKFAKNANSQITCPAKPSKGKSMKQTCLICFEHTDIARMFSIATCTHKYCLSCIEQYVKVKLQSGKVPQCPHEGCKSLASISGCENFLAPELVNDMRERIKESSIPVPEKVYCPYPRCSALMSKKEVFDYTKTSFVSEGGRKCMKCHFYFCINCKVPWHFNMTCDEYRRSKSYLQTEDQKLQSLATKKLWSQCSKCNHMIALGSGCYHMTCRCGHQFCYTCGAKWKNKRATCSCALWSLRNILR